MRWTKYTVLDVIFLFSATIISSAPYLSHLGFYSDDWDFLASFHFTKHQTLLALVESIWSQGPDMQGRPVLAVYLSVAFHLFGLHPMPYHVVNVLVLGSAIFLFYLLLYEIGQPRWIALVLPLTFGFLPHYSTDRFWLAAHQSSFSIAFLFLATYTGVRSFNSKAPGCRVWQGVSILSFVLALLSYEVVLGLIPIALGLIGMGSYKSKHSSDVMTSEWRGLRGWLFGSGYFIAAISALIIVLCVKLQIQTRVGFQHKLEYIRNFPLIAWHATSQGVRFIMGRYGVGLPFSAGNLYRSSGLGAPFLVFDIVVTAVIFIYLDRAFQSSPSFQAVPKHAVKLILIGVLVFVFSYFPFSGNVNIDFLSTGPENRITIAAAIGAACVLIGLFVCIVSFCVPAKFQRWIYCCFVSLLMGLNLICIGALAKYWATAYASQRQILVRIQNDVSPLPTGGVLLLDGFCRYIGPAPVFETDWDSTGALQIVYGNETFSAD